jgi:hypothetical protein
MQKSCLDNERGGSVSKNPSQKQKRKMEARLKKLELLNKVLLVGVVLALVPWAVAAAEKIPDLIQGTNGKFKTVETEQVVLVDVAGNKVGSLTAKKDGANLVLKDGNGKTRLFVGFANGNPTIQFANKNGAVVATYAEKNGWFESVQ